jgi:hypothetical protein
MLEHERSILGIQTFIASGINKGPEVIAAFNPAKV